MKMTATGAESTPSRLVSALVGLVALGLLGLAAADQSVPTGGPVVTLEQGSVRGTVDVGSRSFRGLPYASPPTGDGRWRSPLPPAPWAEVLDGTRPAPPCPQSLGPADPSTVVGSEDCLTLDVHTPDVSGEPLPVLVYLHGGGFVEGSGGDAEASRLVRQGRVVVVAVNYRLGALGFLDHPGMDDPAAGNFGLADQQAALRWVRRNVAAFGGDPGNLTLWGQSAGAFATCAQLAAPGARGLFEKAIAQSGPCGNRLLARREAEARAVNGAAALGCAGADALRCLRGRPPAALVGWGAGRVYTVHRDVAELPWLPVSGTPTLPDDPIEAVARGQTAAVPVLQGSTRDEMLPFVLLTFDAAGRSLTTERYPEVVRAVFGAAAPLVLGRYRSAKHATAGRALSAALSDEGRMLGTCRRLAFGEVAARRAPVYEYEFAADGHDAGDGLGAGHGDDLPYLFDDVDEDGRSRSLDAAGDALSGRLVDQWTTFARTGHPAPGWRPHPAAMSLSQQGATPVDLAHEHRCDLWRTAP